MKSVLRRRLARWDSLGQEAPAVSANKATLLKYSAALGAAAAMATSAEAGIIHTTGPVTVSRTGVGTFTAPVDVGLGGDVVNLRVEFGGASIFGGSQNGEATLFGSAGNNVRFAAAQLYDGRAFAVNLAENATIGASMAPVLNVNLEPTAVNFAAAPYVQVNRTFDNVGQFQDGAPGFVGLELTIASNVYYGWMKLSVASAASPTGMTAIEWAYNDVAGQSISAGDVGSGGGGGNEVPEPATAGLALLAAGSAGVLAWRRRRNNTLAA